MPNYFDHRYNIITFDEYFKNISSYQYSNYIKIEDKNYFDIIQKDYFKDFYCSMIDNDIEPRWGENLLDKLVENNSSYDYLIVDRDNIKLYLKSYELLTLFLLDFVYYIDMEEYEKFEFLNSIIRYENTDFVVKLERVARNIRDYPIEISEINHNFDFIEGYKYNGLII